jgi:hypothetical protein
MSKVDEALKACGEAAKRWRTAPALRMTAAILDLCEAVDALIAAERERCAKVCEQKVKRPAGYHGQWEGYGSHMGDMTGPECAAAIRAGGEKA